jgi:ketosteroid isomerase-like protein
MTRRRPLVTQTERPVVAHAADTWARLSEMLEKAELADLPSLYHQDAVYLEPYNPPHNGNLLIQAYLKDYLGGKDDVDIAEKKVIESEDGRYLAVEWTISYTAAGRRWNELPRASFLEFDGDGRIVHHRDYA